MRALLVDDSTVLKRLTRICLRDSDIEIEERGLASCVNGFDSLPDVDVAVIGTYVPFEKALHLIERIAGSSPRPAIVALMTDPRKEQREVVRDAGADRILTLPCSPDLIRETIISSVGRRGSVV